MVAQDVYERDLSVSTALSRYYVNSMIEPLAIVGVLNQARVSFVLVGAHGLVGWTKEPRATQDVDVIVAARHHKKAIRELVGAYPNLKVDDHEVVTRLRDCTTEQVLIDVMKPNQPYRAVFKNAQTVVVGNQTYRIPSLEMALAMKFAPMVSMVRDEPKKLRDISDFILIVRANPQIDFDRLSDLGDLVYTGGGQKLVELVRKVQAGEKLIL